MPTYRELLARVKSEIDEIDPRDAAEALDVGRAADPDRRARGRRVRAGAIKGAVHIPRGNLESRIEAAVPDRSAPVIISCQSGARSAFAAKALQELGYEHVTSLAGGFSRWKQNGHAWAVPAVLDAERRRRYSRHILIPEVGEAGQLKLLSVQGPDDRRGRPRLARRPLPGRGRRRHARHHRRGHRRRLEPAAADPPHDGSRRHGEDGVGPRSADRAEPRRRGRRRTTSASPPANIDRILAGYDLVVDGTDNFPTRTCSTTRA